MICKGHKDYAKALYFLRTLRVSWNPKPAGTSNKK